MGEAGIHIENVILENVKLCFISLKNSVLQAIIR